MHVKLACATARFYPEQSRLDTAKVRLYLFKALDNVDCNVNDPCGMDATQD